MLIAIVVDESGVDVLVTKKFLHAERVSTAAEESRCERSTEVVTSEARRQTSGSNLLADYVGEAGGIEVGEPLVR